MRADLTGMVSYAIDDEGSNDPDDAIGFADGLVWVHVADPAAVVTPDSPADLEARERGENLYLPERISHMLPPEATDIFGLGLQEISPAMSFGIRITPEGEAVLEKIELSTIRAERSRWRASAPSLNVSRRSAAPRGRCSFSFPKSKSGSSTAR